MDNQQKELIKRLYEESKGDSSELFKTLQAISIISGWEEPLSYLEQCVVEKRISWLDKHAEALVKTSNPVMDAYRLFYETYLGLSLPQDGEIVEVSENKLVTRWWNFCPTLVACQKLHLDTREICKRAYHKPVQALFSRLDPRLKFERNYAALRPYAPYCEEIIVLETNDVEGSNL